MCSSLSFFPLSLSVCSPAPTTHLAPPLLPALVRPQLPDRARRSDSLWFSSRCLNILAINAAQREGAGEVWGGAFRRGHNWLLTGNSESEGDGSARGEAGREGEAGRDGDDKSDSRGFNVNLRRVEVSLLPMIVFANLLADWRRCPRLIERAQVTSGTRGRACRSVCLLRVLVLLVFQPDAA